MAVAIRGPEGIIFRKGFGFRNKEQTIKPDEDTIFGIASMSKSMVGLACCMLQIERKLNLKDPMVKYFPKLHVPGVPDEMVTVERVALHRAGIPPMEPLEWSIAMNSKERDFPGNSARRDRGAGGRIRKRQNYACPGTAQPDEKNRW